MPWIALERKPRGKLDLPRRPVRVDELLDAISGVGVHVALNVERIEGVDVETELPTLGDPEITYGELERI